MKRRWIIAIAAALGAAGLLGLTVWERRAWITVEAEPVGIMGTRTRLLVVVRPWHAEKARQALAQAEAVLRAVEAKMSHYLEGSEIGRLNAAPAGTLAPLSSETVRVLLASRRYTRQTDGAFDVTCGPILQLWKEAGQRNRLPTEPELEEARARTGWKHLELRAEGAVKDADGVRVDLGGIAKKYAIDRATEALLAWGETLRGGLIDVGGDIRCFGEPARGGPWSIGIAHPFERGRQLGTLQIRAGAVCTSGNYERFVEIGGRRYSHIVDPRTGRPADAVPSVTVIGPTAITGVWATALSVRGAPGLDDLPQDAGIEVLLIEGTPENHRCRMTDGFRRYLAGPLATDSPREGAGG